MKVVEYKTISKPHVGSVAISCTPINDIKSTYRIIEYIKLEYEDTYLFYNSIQFIATMDKYEDVIKDEISFIEKQLAFYK